MGCRNFVPMRPLLARLFLWLFPSFRWVLVSAIWFLSFFCSCFTVAGRVFLFLFSHLWILPLGFRFRPFFFWLFSTQFHDCFSPLLDSSSSSVPYICLLSLLFVLPSLGFISHLLELSSLPLFPFSFTFSLSLSVPFGFRFSSFLAVSFNFSSLFLSIPC